MAYVVAFFCELLYGEMAAVLWQVQGEHRALIAEGETWNLLLESPRRYKVVYTLRHYNPLQRLPRCKVACFYPSKLRRYGKES
jgi:hypothetical protein